MSVINKHMLELKFQLHCHRMAGILLARDLLFLTDDNIDGKVHPMIWCGAAFLPDMVEDADCWESAEWSDIPLLHLLYTNFGEVGLFVWCVKKRHASKDILAPIVIQFFATVAETICQYKLGVKPVYNDFLQDSISDKVH